MKKIYPVISLILNKATNTQAKCKCGKVAKFKTEIQVNYMRGEEEYYWSCYEHKKDIDYLL